jgi:glucokinase
VELLQFFSAEKGRVTVGDFVSGPGLRSLYRFLSGTSAEPAEIAARAEAHPESLAGRAVRLFVSIYGARAGDVALAYNATGGVYIGGGIAPKLLPRFLDGTFMEAFLDKGSLRWFLERVPVQVVLNADTALLGAAMFARDAAALRLAA